jgi:hypothetical protein
MNENTRAAVAIIAASVVNGRNYRHVRDVIGKTSRVITVSVTAGRIDAYDHGEACAINGQLPGSLYHHGNKKFIEMDLMQSKVEGFDYESGCFYDGVIIDAMVELYDHGTSSFHLFEVS